MQQDINSVKTNISQLCSVYEFQTLEEISTNLLFVLHKRMHDSPSLNCKVNLRDKWALQ